MSFFFNYTATTEIYTVMNTLSLHDALPISRDRPGVGRPPGPRARDARGPRSGIVAGGPSRTAAPGGARRAAWHRTRSIAAPIPAAGHRNHRRGRGREWSHCSDG